MLTVSHPQPASYSWYQFYLVNKDTRALVACPELLVRKLVESGIEPATLRSTGRNLNHTTYTVVHINVYNMMLYNVNRVIWTEYVTDVVQINA